MAGALTGADEDEVSIASTKWMRVAGGLDSKDSVNGKSQTVQNLVQVQNIGNTIGSFSVLCVKTAPAPPLATDPKGS